MLTFMVYRKEFIFLFPFSFSISNLLDLSEAFVIEKLNRFIAILTFNSPGIA